MTEFGQYILNGISQACIYVLIASGLTLILGILRVPNFAQGHVYMLGAYTTFYCVASFRINYWLSLVFATIAMGILGLIIYRIIFHPLRNTSEVNLFVAALGLLMVLEGAALYFFGPVLRWFRVPHPWDVLTFGGITLPFQRLIIIIGTIVVMLSLQFFIKRTTIGSTLEATAQNRSGAMLCGIRVYVVSAMAFAIGTALAGIAGVLVGPIRDVDPSMGMTPLLIAFSAVIFGGLGSIPGAVAGALVMGLVESLASGYISATYSSVFIFGVMILILLFRPKGILGR